MRPVEANHTARQPPVSWKAVPLPAGRWPDNTGLCLLGSCVHGLAALGEAAFKREEEWKEEGPEQGKGAV